MTDATHQDLILDQFTRQATVFSIAPAITDEDALQMIVQAARPTLNDRLLDVACGPGLVVCAFAPHVQAATGIDVTPAMLERARKLAADKGLADVAWRQGDVSALPYVDASFTIVTTRFSFHHFLDPAAVPGADQFGGVTGEGCQQQSDDHANYGHARASTLLGR